MLFKKLDPRLWSNMELKKFAGLFTGEVINVSGWLDQDKAGEYYKNYFFKAKNYFLSNYPLDKDRGDNNQKVSDFFLDLEKELPTDFIERFDVVFNHTVLEHVKNPIFVFKNLAQLTRDILIIIVPFKQKLHFSPSNYGDYYRFSPMAMRALFKENHFNILYESYTPYPAIDVYLFYIGSKQEKKWETLIPRSILNLNELNGIMGMNDIMTLSANLFFNIAKKINNVLKSIK